LYPWEPEEEVAMRMSIAKSLAAFACAGVIVAIAACGGDSESDDQSGDNGGGAGAGGITGAVTGGTGNATAAGGSLSSLGGTDSTGSGGSLGGLGGTGNSTGSGGSSGSTGSAGSSGSAASSGSGGSSGSAGSAGSSTGSGGSSGSTGSGGTAGSAGTTAIPFETDLPDDTLLGELTEEQYEQYCEQALEYVVTRALVPGCRYYAATYALELGDAALCDALLTVCLGMEPEEVQSRLGIQSDCTKPDDCNATAAQMEACVNDLAAQAEEALDIAPECSELTDTTVLEPPTEPPTPASCELVEAACPGALSGFSMTMPAGV
jgi:hypothetical protein